MSTAEPLPTTTDDDVYEVAVTVTVLVSVPKRDVRNQRAANFVAEATVREALEDGAVGGELPAPAKSNLLVIAPVTLLRVDDTATAVAEGYLAVRPTGKAARER